MATYEQITYDVSNFVATITLNRPEKLNAWTPKMEDEVFGALRSAAADDKVRVILLTGAGKGFCAGADMSLLTALSQGETPHLAPLMGEMEGNGDAGTHFRKKYAWLLFVPKPIIAAVNGPAVGLGFIIPLYC